MQLDFTDKRVLVTGGTRGIGRAIVEAFLEAGARVALNGSTEETTGKAVAELDGGDRVVAAPGFRRARGRLQVDRRCRRRRPGWARRAGQQCRHRCRGGR